MTSLLSRLKAATGADRELDRELFEQATGKCTHRSQREEYVWDVVHICNDCGAEHPPADFWPRYTASIDAALALVERKLPGHGVNLWAWPNEASASIGTKAIDFAEYMQAAGSGKAPTAPLAILIALLTALEQENPNGT